MTIYERIESLRNSKNISQGKLERELGFSNGSISKWKNSMPKPERLQKIADYFGVSMEYLMTGETLQELKRPVINTKNEKDIKKDLDNIMEKISTGADGPASYDGEELSPESLELFRGELEIALKRLKLINKEKYNPHKNKK